VARAPPLSGAALLIGRLGSTRAPERGHRGLRPAFPGFLWIVGANAVALLRGEESAATLPRSRLWLLALAVPVAFLAAAMDCMGLSFVGCTSACGFLMHYAAPATALCTLLFAATGARGWLFAANLLALAFFVPNCTCSNPVNRGWIESLGRSPACFASAVGVFLLASTTLVTGRKTLLATLLAWGVVATTLAFFVGHHYFHFPW
jgi:hypothetical protein